MNTQKGYIIPIILIMLLVVLGGVFVFSQKQAESPVVESPNNNQNVNISNIENPADTTLEIEKEPEILEQNIDNEEDLAPIGSVARICITDQDCATEEICFIAEGDTKGYCY